MKPLAGRAYEVSQDQLKGPDPGAQAVALWLRAIYDVCKISDFNVSSEVMVITIEEK